MELEKVKIEQLEPAAYNPRQISTKQYKDLKESITKFGIVDPLIVNKNSYTIVGGHQRYKICKELGYKEIGCIILDLDKEQERELNIRLNKNTGEFDMDLLSSFFDVPELKEWGFKEIDLDINIDKLVEDTEDVAILTIKEEDLIKAEQLYKELKERGFDVKKK